jgi:hypothetical protein
MTAILMPQPLRANPQPQGDQFLYFDIKIPLTLNELFQNPSRVKPSHKFQQVQIFIEIL